MMLWIICLTELNIWHVFAMSSVMCAVPHFHKTRPNVNLAKLQSLFREAGWAEEAHPVVAEVNVMKFLFSRHFTKACCSKKFSLFIYV